MSLRKHLSAFPLALALALAVAVAALACSDDAGSSTPESDADTESDADSGDLQDADTAPDVPQPDVEPDGDAPTDTPSDAPDGDAGPPALPRLAFEEITWVDAPDAVTKLRFVPGTDDEVLVLQQMGTVYHYRLTEAGLEELGSFSIPEVHLDRDCGLISMALDPDFTSNGFLYLGYCTAMEFSGIYRYRFDAEDYVGIPATRTEIISLGDPTTDRPYHNVGDFGFDPEGRMWALFGEKRRSYNAQDTTNDLGSLIRIWPNREADGSGYEPVEDNPFFDDPPTSPDLLAWGLRSPWTGLLDAHGRFFIGDVGEDTWEEINVLDSEAGVNFGWPNTEGTTCHEEPCTGHQGPLRLWAHDFSSPYIAEDVEAVPTVLRLAYVGFAYQGGRADPYGGELEDIVVYGDMCLGFVRGIVVAEDGTVLADGHLGHLANPTSWTQGPDGYVYVTTYGACESPRGTPLPPSRLWRLVLAED